MRPSTVISSGLSGAALASALLVSGAALAQPANDLCTSPTGVAGFGEFAFDTTGGATDGAPLTGCDGAGTANLDVWFCWTAPETARVAASTCGLVPYDTVVAVYAGCAPCPAPGAVAGCDDDTTGCANNTSRAVFDATGGQSYLIRVGGYGATDFGPGTLNLAPAEPRFTNPANGHVYVLLEPSVWTAAEARAVAMGGHLATVNDAEENEWIRATIANFGGDRRLWIGFNDAAAEGTFVWTSGEADGYTNWNGGEPNNASGTEHYTELFGSSGQWNDQPDNGGRGQQGVVELPGTPPAAPTSTAPAPWTFRTSSRS